MTQLTTLEHHILNLRAEGHGWSSIAREVQLSRRQAHAAWHHANRQLCETTTNLEITPAIQDATIGNEELLRGIPTVGRVSGTIKGTRPGDPAWLCQRDATLT